MEQQQGNVHPIIAPLALQLTVDNLLGLANLGSINQTGEMLDYETYLELKRTLILNAANQIGHISLSQTTQ